jgi:predicted MFS family arabinose efflux permease
LLIFGLFGSACAAAPDFRTLLALRFLQGIGVAPLGILFPTIIGDLYEDQERTAALGYTMAALSLGSGGFPIVGGALGMLGWQYPFLLAVVALPLSASVHFSLRSPEPRSTQDLKEYLKGTFSLLQTRRVLGILILSFLTSVILYGPVVTYLPVLLQERFHISTASIGLLLSLSALITAAAASQFGRLAGRPGAEVRVLGAAFVLYLLSMAIIPLTFRLWVFVLPICLFGAAMGLNAPTRVSLLTGLAPQANRAAIISMNSVALRIGQTTAPVLMGMVAAGLGIESVYWCGIVVSLGMMAALAWMMR